MSFQKYCNFCFFFNKREIPGEKMLPWQIPHQHCMQALIRKCNAYYLKKRSPNLCLGSWILLLKEEP